MYAMNKTGHGNWDFLRAFWGTGLFGHLKEGISWLVQGELTYVHRKSQEGSDLVIRKKLQIN